MSNYEELEDKLLFAETKLKRQQRQIAELEEVLALTGVQDKSTQIEHLKDILTGLMELPGLSAKKPKGRVGELSRMKLSSNVGAGEDVPMSLRGPNFHRAQGNRIEAERVWAEQKARAEQLIKAGELPQEAWDEAVSGGNFIYSDLSKMLDWVTSVNAFHDRLHAKVSSYLPSEPVPIPPGFVDRLNHSIESTVRHAHLQVGKRGLGSDTELNITAKAALEHAFAFVPEDAEWRKRGMTQQEWEDRDPSLYQTKRAVSTELADDWSGGFSQSFAELFIQNDFDSYKREVEAHPELLKNTHHWHK